jgi:uncharacterized tellurite resistance protein B-like protein
MRDKKPIPADWALRWAEAEPTIYFRTPATRCPREFEAAFSEIYKARFGEGLIVPANKKLLKLVYEPGWPVHTGLKIPLNTPGIPDIAALTAPVNTLKEVVDQATNAIDNYSRFLGRNPGKEGGLEACLYLQPSLWPAAAKSSLAALKAEYAEPLEPIAFDALLLKLGITDDPANAKVTEIAGSLRHASIGFEPDVLCGARRPHSGDSVVLFPLASEADSDRSGDEYKKASLTVALAACAALADGHVSREEMEAIDAMIANWRHLEPDQHMRLRAQYRLQIRQSLSLANLRTKLQTLPAESRLQLARSLSSLAAADGTIDAGEVKLLEQIYRTLDLDTKLLYSHLYAGNSPSSVLATTAINQLSPGYSVDTERLASLRRETEQVGELLA